MQLERSHLIGCRSEVIMERTKGLFGAVFTRLFPLAMFVVSGTALEGLSGDFLHLSGRRLLQDAIGPDKVDHSRLPRASIVVGGVAAGLAVFFLALTAIGFFQNRWEVKIVDFQQQKRSGKASAPPFMMASEPEKFMYKELQSGTLNFTDKIGRSGRVFKGVLYNTTDVAIKRLDAYPRLAFEHDVKQAAALHNDSLVHLFGYCSESDHRLLVYEYLAKGSLGDYIYGSPISEPMKKTLSWSTRFRIVLWTARALAYVHNHGGQEERLNIHGRIHPENVLLTDSFYPKLADLGFTRPITGRGRTLLHADALGKYEYFAPEWWSLDLTTPLTQKSDVYSYGILVLEIVAGRPIGDFYKSRTSWEFPDLTHAFDREGNQSGSTGSVELLDPELKSTVDENQLRAALHVAYWCIQSESEARPTMTTVVEFLEGRRRMELPPTPSSSVVFTPTRRSHQGEGVPGFRSGRRSRAAEIVHARSEGGART